MKNHHADDCRMKHHSKNAKNKNSKPSNSEGDGDKSSKPKSSIPLTEKQVAQVVQALSLSANKSSKKHGKKEAESSDDDDSDSSWRGDQVALGQLQSMIIDVAAGTALMLY